MVDRLRSSALFTGIAVLVCVLAGAGMAAAQTLLGDAHESAPNLSKVSSHLLQARALAADERSAAEIAAAVPALELRDGLPKVAIRLDSLTPEIVEKLRRAGLEIDSYHLGYARAYGRVDPADLDELAALPEVVTIQPMPRRGTRVGSAENQADVTMNANDVRALTTLDGTGVEVGVLSDSFRDLSPGSVAGTGCSRAVTQTSSQLSGDLPASVVSLDDGPGGGIDEARAIGELMFDIAPGADFSFHSAFNSPADFAGGITELVGCGADIVVDDVFWTQQAFFQDDVIAQAAQGAVEAGVPYFSAAGNDATFGVDEVFNDTDVGSSPCFTFPPGKIVPDDSDFHDFGGGDHYAAITVPDDCDIYAELQWSDPFDSIGSGPGASSDFDLFLLDSPVDPQSVSGANIIDASFSEQASSSCATMQGDPVESVYYTNFSGSTETYYLAVDSCCSGGGGSRFRIVTISFECGTTSAPWDFEDGFDIVGGLPVPDPSETPIFNKPQIFGHPAAKDVFAVGATFFREIDLGGDLDPPPAPQLDVEPYSSLGGDIPFYFDTNGVLLPGAPETRFKPEVTGPDGTNTTFFGADIPDFLEPPGDTDPNFFGTSAAAPHSAAVAVLALDATDNLISIDALRQLLFQSVIDMEITGLDPLSGVGFTDALRPLSSLDAGLSPLIDDLEFDLDGGAFFTSPPSPPQRLQANNSILYEDGDFSGLDAVADLHIFADGFESGDTSAWSSSSP